MAFVRADSPSAVHAWTQGEPPRRVAARASRACPASLRARFLGFVDVPPEIGVFHHGSYVGATGPHGGEARSLGHADEVRPNWLEDVWDPWTPEARDFNPVYPDMFPGAAEIDPRFLPQEIVGQPWPPEYLDGNT